MADSNRTALQIMVEFDRGLFQHFDFRSWNAFADNLCRHELTPTVWAPGSRPPPVGLFFDFRRLMRAHYRLDGINLGLGAMMLDGANFEGASLKGARLTSCPGANFRNARLQGAIFLGDISGCDFTGAELHDAQFEEATYDPARPPIGMPPEILAAMCKAETPDPSAPANNRGRFAERPLKACVTIAENPW